MQIFCSMQNSSDPERFQTLHSYIRRGDIIGIQGFPGRTKTGELSLYAQHMWLLAPCKYNLPLNLIDPVSNIAFLDSNQRNFALAFDQWTSWSIPPLEKLLFKEQRYIREQTHFRF